MKANYPDFTHKDTRVGLWLNQAPVGVLQGLGRLEFFNTPNKDGTVHVTNKDETVHLPNKYEKVKGGYFFYS